ncbi:MAG: methylmalonyl Co-A mutase-associated GTPase MeaB [Actinobacteria bacterium]|nr:methylmalonyl Co-A mutase-associated GTPase MeaB [Actinomycetota bacterium]
MSADAAAIRSGARRAVGRAISLAERRAPGARALLAELAPLTGAARRIGLTGPPGVGKSTLLAALVTHLRALGTRVAVVSVDPSSPFTRGAILGDRIRLTEHFLDAGVFIRSMASRGHVGGCAEAVSDAVLILDAAGFDVIFVETVGAGQNEVEVASLADTVVLSLMPGSGDSIQAIKAGVMEIPDVIAITKADRPGAQLLKGELESAFRLGPTPEWAVPIVPTVALSGTGIGELWSALEAHRAFLAVGDRLRARRRAGLARQLAVLALDRLAHRLEVAATRDVVSAVAEDVLEHRVPLWEAVDSLVAATFAGARDVAVGPGWPPHEGPPRTTTHGSG